jgi:hypothetical protein
MTVEVYIHNTPGAPWGHAAINISGTVYHQGGVDGGLGGNMLAGRGYYYRVPYAVYYQSQVPKDTRLERYRILKLNAHKAKGYLDRRFWQGALPPGVPRGGATNKVVHQYNAATANCSVVVSNALQAGELQFFIGAYTPTALASQLGMNPHVKRLADLIGGREQEVPAWRQVVDVLI